MTTHRLIIYNILSCFCFCFFWFCSSLEWFRHLSSLLCEDNSLASLFFTALRCVYAVSFSLPSPMLDVCERNVWQIQKTYNLQKGIFEKKCFTQNNYLDKSLHLECGGLGGGAESSQAQSHSILVWKDNDTSDDLDPDFKVHIAPTANTKRFVSKSCKELSIRQSWRHQQVSVGGLNWKCVPSSLLFRYRKGSYPD